MENFQTPRNVLYRDRGLGKEFVLLQDKHSSGWVNSQAPDLPFLCWICQDYLDDRVFTFDIDFFQQMLQFHGSMHTFPSWLLQTSPGWMLDELLISLQRVLYWSLFISDLLWKPLLKGSYLCHQGCTKESNEIDFLSHLELATACSTSKPRHLFWDSLYNLLFWNSGYCLFIGLCSLLYIQYSQRSSEVPGVWLLR